MSLIGKNVGNYVIKSQLGEGGMGTVYLGEHPLIGKKVAVKVLLEELAAKEDIVSRFFTEAKSVNDIGHQNIVDIVDFGKIKNDQGRDTVYFIMEYLDGESLADRIRSTGVTGAEAVHIGLQCCAALTASHAKGIVHRDLKPENIYLCPRGGDKNFVKILDFGIAKLTGDGGTSSHKTRTGLVVGTPAYMSPEQCEGKGNIDHRSDVYALGVVMYELLTGQVPFPGDGFGEILVAHLTREVPRPTLMRSDVTLELESIVLHALEKDKNRRFQSMKEFGDALSNPTAHLATYQELPPYSGSPPQVAGSGTQFGTPPSASTGLRPQATGSVPLTTGSTNIRGPLSIETPRPTTLSGAAAEVGSDDLAALRKNRTALYASIGVAIALVGIGGTMMAMRGGAAGEKTVQSVVAVPSPSTASASPAASPAPSPASSQKIVVAVSTVPSGAKVMRGKEVVGETPYEFKLDKGTAPFEVRFMLDGYEPSARTISSDRGRDIEVALTKAAATAPAQPKIKKKRRTEEDSGGEKILAPSF